MATSLLVVTICLFDSDSDAAEPVTLPTKWTTLYVPDRKASALPIKPATGLVIDGGHAGHPFLPGVVKATGQWTVVDRCLAPAGGDDAALALGSAQDFELEGRLDASGVGGMFFLFGHRDGLGTLLSNVTMRESGSPWRLAALRGNEAIVESEVEEHHPEWKGELPFGLQVADGKVTLKVADRTFFDRQPLQYDGEGAIYFGVYGTKYGVRPVKIRSLRIRSLPTKDSE